MKVGVIVFPGSNCDQDAYYAFRDNLRQPVEYIWYQETDLKGVDLIVLPGGFSYGDYLRTGAIARFAPVMRSVEKYANSGKLVLGICNGFQVLCEAGLLPGALVRNAGLKFVCRYVNLRVENAETALTVHCQVGQILRIPIAHGDGCYVCDEETYERLNRNRQIIFRYCETDGRTTLDSNPNGSMDNIAGIANERFNVFGMMPHPERATEKLMGSADGRLLFSSLIDSVANGVRTGA
ncbi:MAG: phosphoribosylformylglycinamidine synthase subunit PurQ [Armatimonadetes bacterium]|nr:phosphoribosylformylglycinamidine synthase subunit PurQ [Armatimonadota bacterium]